MFTPHPTNPIKCPYCYGDGFNMGADGPHPCRPCKWDGVLLFASLPTAKRHLAALRAASSSMVDGDLDALRLSALDRRARQACVERAPWLYAEDPFAEEIAGLTEVRAGWGRGERP
jgi:hypothetical protein